MDSYQVRLLPKAYRDIADIYEYISTIYKSVSTAKKQTDRIKKAILDLKCFAYSHQERQEGQYANLGYRQLLIGNCIAIYRVDEKEKTVYVVTVQYHKRML